MEPFGTQTFGRICICITPFNFTSICANLCAAPAMLGNVVVWKPAETQIYSAQVIMEIFQAAGLPDGVINMVTVSGRRNFKSSI